MKNVNVNIILLIGGIIAILILVKVFFGKKKTREEKLAESKKREEEHKAETLKILEKQEKIKEQIAEEKEKMDIKKFDTSPDNPLSGNYVFSKNYSPSKEQKNVGKYRIALKINDELSNYFVDEDTVTTLIGELKTRDSIAHWRQYMLQTEKIDWVSKIASAYKGLTDPYKDLRKLYATIKELPKS